MAAINLQTHPSLSNAESRKRAICLALGELDEHINLLGLTAGCAAGNAECEDDIVHALEFLHSRLRREVNKLMTLL